VQPAPEEQLGAPFTDERALVEALHEAASARVAAIDGARREAARMRSLNDRMHAQAVETIRAARESAEASIREECASELERIEERAALEAERVRREEAKIRADAARHAEKAEEEARGKYEERIWMAESVYEAALPEIRKWREAQVTRADAARAQVAALVSEAESVVRGYRQRPLRAAPSPDAPADAASIRDAAALLQERLDALRACRSAGIFRGPILAVPAILVPAAGAGIGALLAGPLGAARGKAALWGAVAGAAVFVVATAVLWSIARREVRARHGAFVEVASRALGGLERLRTAAERTSAEREAAAKARHDTDIAAADATFQPALADIEQKLREYVATVDQRAPHYHAKVLKQRARR
jgi:hypothetical protein